MKTIAILLTVSAFLVSGCGFKQDPLTGQSDRLRGAGPKKPQKPIEPVETNNLLIDTSGSTTFTVGEQASITATGRSLEPDLFDKVFVIVENMDEFPDATFDEKGGKFEWTPRVGTTGSATEVRKVVKFRAYSTSSKDEDLGTHTAAREVAITVIKIPEVPTIVQDVDLPPSLHEGEDEIFHVLVKDKDGGVLEPVLQFSNPSDASLASLSSFITVLRTQYDASTQLWTYDCRIVIRGEITGSKQEAGFAVAVLSGFGKISPAIERRVNVYTSLDLWKSTWNKKLILAPKVLSNTSFVIFSPKGEGKISIVKTTLPGTSKLACDPSPAAGYMNCMLTYTPEGTDSRRFESIDLEVKIQNTDSGDTNFLTSKMSFTFQVEKL